MSWHRASALWIFMVLVLIPATSSIPTNTDGDTGENTGSQGENTGSQSENITSQSENTGSQSDNTGSQSENITSQSENTGSQSDNTGSQSESVEGPVPESYGDTPDTGGHSEADGNDFEGLLDCNKSDFTVFRGIVPPYTFTEGKSVVGPVHHIVEYAIERCCGHNITMTASKDALAERDVEEKMRAEDLAYPVVKTGNLGIAAGQVHGYLYVPVIETPGAVVLTVSQDRHDNVVIQSLSQCWPLALVVLSSAGLAGVFMWLLDHGKNSCDFPQSFIHGGWEGIWWAFVTMTTVGYGDKAPKSIPARMFGLVWMFVGIILMSIFTATLTTALTADQAADFEVKGTKIGILAGSKEHIVAFQEGAQITAFRGMSKLLDALKNGTIEGALVDTNYALSMATKFDEDGISVTMNLPNPAMFGIILQGLRADIETCFTKFISKSQFRAYDSLSMHLDEFHKDERPSATKATQHVLASMKLVFVVLFCVWFMVTVACLVWDFIFKRRILHRKTSASRKVAVCDTRGKQRTVSTESIVHS